MVDLGLPRPDVAPPGWSRAIGSRPAFDAGAALVFEPADAKIGGELRMMPVLGKPVCHHSPIHGQQPPNKRDGFHLRQRL